MNFKQAQIDNFLKKPDDSYRGVLIYGTNEGLISQYTDSFIRAICPDIFDPFRVTYFNMSAIIEDKPALIAEYNAQSLMGGRRVIVVKDADDSLNKQMPQIFESPSNSFLVISSTTLKKKSALVLTAEENEKFICISCYDDRDESIYTSARQKFIDEGYTIDPDALKLLCSRLSGDRKANINEIEKLITYVGNKKDITVSDIVATIGDLTSLSSDDLVFAVASGDFRTALSSYEKLLNEGTEVISVIRSIYYHFYRILQCKAYMENKIPFASAITKLRPPLVFFRKVAFEKQVAMWDKSNILDVISLLYNAERSCKTTNMPAQEIAGYTIMQICTRAKNIRNQK